MKSVIARYLAGLFVISLLTACGGGSLDSLFPGNNSSSGNLQPASEDIPISAAGIKGPLAFADAKIFAFDSSFPDFYDENSPLSSAISNEFAQITGLSVPGNTQPPYILTIGGGNAIDLNTGETPVIPMLITVITADMLTDNQPVYATPLTTLVFDMARFGTGTSGNVNTFVQLTKDASTLVSRKFALDPDVAIDVLGSPLVINGNTTTVAQQQEAVHHRAALEAFAAKVYTLSLPLGKNTTNVLIERIARDLQSDGVIDNSADGETIGGIDPAVLNQNPMNLQIPNTSYQVENIVALMEEERILTGTDKGPVLLVDSINFGTQPAENPDTSNSAGPDPVVTPDPVVIADPVVTPDPVIVLTSFPVDQRGNTPEKASITINISKPTGATNGVMTLTTYDADFPDEGELVINGNTPVSLFGTAGVSGNDQNSADITITTPASYWKDGANDLFFTHTNTYGYIIDDVSVSFDIDTPISVSPPVNVPTDNIIFNVDFENRVANSTYTKTQLIQDFNANDNDGGIEGPNYGNTTIASDPTGNTRRGNVLKILHRAGEMKVGASFKARFAPDNQNKKGSARFDDVYFAYDVYLPPNTLFMPVQKLPGLMAGTKLEASHPYDRQTTVEAEGVVAFSARMSIYNSASFPAIPAGKSSLVTYTYDAQRTRNVSFLNTSDPYQNIDNSLGANIDKLYMIPTGRWVTIEQRVKLNTADSNDTYNSDNDRKNGLIQMWVDGELMLSRKHLWRWTNTMKIDGFWFIDYYNNRPELSSPPHEDQFVYYDNIKVSTSPITH